MEDGNGQRSGIESDGVCKLLARARISRRICIVKPRECSGATGGESECRQAAAVGSPLCGSEAACLAHLRHAASSGASTASPIVIKDLRFDARYGPEINARLAERPVRLEILYLY